MKTQNIADNVIVKQCRPSRFDLIAKCPAAAFETVRFRQAFGDEPSGLPAEQGTAAHHVAELVLTERLQPAKVHEVCTTLYFKIVKGQVKMYKRKVAGSFSLDETYAEAVLSYLRIFDTLKSRTDSFEKHVELKLTMSVTGRNGYADSVLIDKNTKTAYVFDFKAGRGVAVKAEFQGLLYATAVLNEFSYLDRARFFIIQPRTPEGAPYSEVVDIYRSGLAEAEQNIATVVARALEPEPEYVVGSHCMSKFCPAMSICPKIIREVEDIPTGDAEKQLLSWLKVGPLTKRAFDRCNQQLKALAISGELPDGVVVKRRKGRASWNEKDMPASVASVLRERDIETHKTEPITPAQTKTALKKTGYDFGKIDVLLEKTTSRAEDSLSFSLEGKNDDVSDIISKASISKVDDALKEIVTPLTKEA